MRHNIKKDKTLKNHEICEKGARKSLSSGTEKQQGSPLSPQTYTLSKYGFWMYTIYVMWELQAENLM